jgi:hypothetical protein
MSVSVSVGARRIERGGADGGVKRISRLRRREESGQRRGGLATTTAAGGFAGARRGIGRFEALVVRGPGADDCAIWKGAIGGDGYGRYWVRRGCSEQIMVRANRYALAAAPGR